jgi:hypothetical protein
VKKLADAKSWNSTGNEILRKLLSINGSWDTNHGAGIIVSKMFRGTRTTAIVYKMVRGTRTTAQMRFGKLRM